MSNQLYYAISGLFTLLIGLPLAFNPIILVPLYYLITKIVFNVFNKTPTELDNIENYLIEALYLKYIIAKISYYMKVVTDFIFNLINIIYINPLKWVVNYQTKWIEWISSINASSYFLGLLTDSINFIIFQIQETINFGFNWASTQTAGLVKKNPVGIVDLPLNAYILGDIFNVK